MANKKTETEEIKAEVKAEPKAKAKVKDDDRVEVFVPFTEGEDPEQTVIVNYKAMKFRKGEMVKVPKNVAKVLANASKQNKAALANQKKFEKQVMDL